MDQRRRGATTRITVRFYGAPERLGAEEENRACYVGRRTDQPHAGAALFSRWFPFVL